MRLFIKNLLLFLLPFFVVFAPSFLVLFFAGEFYPLEHVGAMARLSTPILVGPAYSNYRLQYQFQEVVQRQPQIVALGSSRVGQFSSLFFKDPHTFYNAAGTGGALSNFRYFVDGTSLHPPKILLAGMDQYYFNPEDAKNNVVHRPNPFIDPVAAYDPFFESFFRQGGWWKVYADYAAGKFTLHDVLVPRNRPVKFVGIHSLATTDGFKNDGSDYYAGVIQSPAEREKMHAGIESLASSITDTHGDEYGGGISPDSLQELRLFLADAKQKGIVVIGFIPPVSHAVYEELQAHPNATYAYAFKNLGGVLAGVYKEYGFELYDFTDLEAYGSSDKEMAEAKHGSEKTYLRLFIQMAQKNALLGAAANMPTLQVKLGAASSQYEVFTNPDLGVPAL